MRGTQPRHPACQTAARFIPAHAGNTRTWQAPTGTTAVHPRTCGEHQQIQGLPRHCDGSSPHMRGTREDYQPRFYHGRFIPAHAGNTNSRAAGHQFQPVHPRTCGEHPPQRRINAMKIGSSPHMRGTPESVSRYTQSPTVHPRTCGEHSGKEFSYSDCIGSSPHMRGTLPGRTGHPPRRRFIPAHAGNTMTTSHDPPPAAVHPRTCGEHVGNSRAAGHQFGSSPHMRGTPEH